MIVFREWKNLVKAVWKRDNAFCQNCGEHQNVNRNKKFHIHHKISFQVKELRYSFDNLLLLCPKCHRNIHKIRK